MFQRRLKRDNRAFIDCITTVQCCDNLCCPHTNVPTTGVHRRQIAWHAFQQFHTIEARNADLAGNIYSLFQLVQHATGTNHVV